MKNVILILFISINCICYSQERINISKISFTKKSGILSTAIGWYLDTVDSGEWISAINCIGGSSRKNNNIPVRLSSYKMSLLDDNFITMQFGEIKYNDENYYVLILEKWEGLFEYPEIGESWIHFRTKYGYVFSKYQYNKLFNIEGYQLLISYNKAARSGEACITNDILMSLKNDVFDDSFNRPDSPYRHYFAVMKTDEGKIRFHIPTDKYPKNVAEELNKTRDNISKIANYQINDFNNEYFETTLENFNKLLIK